MDIKQDPNAIPHFNGGGRIGELSPDEPEQVQSSVELDPDPADASADTPAGSGQDSPLDNGSSATARPDAARPTGSGGAADVAERQRAGADPSTTGGGSIDGLVGAP